jgi:23S rRNA (cytidine1920-2'-O)/16S rRNA (cytidine1409-2'-O)-methyltransferase
MTASSERRFVSRGGEKLAAALDHFKIDPTGRVCADLGSHVGGFVDCLLQRGAARVYSVDTAYGELAWALRKDSRLIVLDRTNAMHVALPERVSLLTIDVGWTTQERILPHATALIADGAEVVTLIKPHYEARNDERDGGVLRANAFDAVMSRTLDAIAAMNWNVRGTLESPIRGHGGNREVLAWLQLL